MFYGLRPVGYGYHLHHAHAQHQQQQAAMTAHWQHSVMHGGQTTASNLTGQPIKLLPSRGRSESPVKGVVGGVSPGSSTASRSTPSDGTAAISVNTSGAAATVVQGHRPQLGQPVHVLHPHVGQPVFKLGSPGSNSVQQASPTKTQVEKTTVITAQTMRGQPVQAMHTSRMAPVLQPTAAGVSAPRYPHGMHRMPFIQPHLPPHSAAAYYGMHGAGPPYLLPSPNNMHTMAGFGHPPHHIQTTFPHPPPPPPAHMMAPRVAAGVTTQAAMQVPPPPMLSPGGTPQKQPVMTVTKSVPAGMMLQSGAGPLSPPIPQLTDKKLSGSTSAPSFLPPPAVENPPAGYQFLPSAVNVRSLVHKEATASAPLRIPESKPVPPPPAPLPLGKFTGPYSQQSNNHFQLPKKEDGQVLFQNPYLQREFHNYILQTEGHSAASSFMNTIQQYNRSNAHNTVPSPTRSGSHHTNAQLVRATHSENDLGHMQRSENESPSKNSRVKRETVSVHLEEPPRAGSRDSVASYGAPDFSDHSDHSRRSSFSDRSRETSSPLAPTPSGNGFPFSMQPGMGPVHTLSNSQVLGSKQNSQVHTQTNGYTRPQQNGHNVQNYPSTSNNSQQRSGETKSDDLLNDVELPTVVDNMVKFIEDSLEDKHSENELGNIHIGHSPTRLPPSLARPRSASGERQAPLYLRRAPGQGSSSQTQPNLSYASALRNQLPAASSSEENTTSPSVNRESEEQKQQQMLLQQQQRRLQLGLGIPLEVAATSISSKNTDPLLPTSAAGGSRPLSQLMTTSLLPPPTTDPLTPEMSQPADPLDLLKNLKIKASPGTQALYQYFS